MCENPENYDTDQRTRIVAQLYSDSMSFRNDFHAFSRGEPGAIYSRQYEKPVQILDVLTGVVSFDDPQAVAKDIEKARDALIEAAQSIPVPIESAIHES